MTAPTIVAGSVYGTSPGGNETTSTITTPSHTDGDGIYGVIVSDLNTGQTFTWPAGWTELYHNQQIITSAALDVAYILSSSGVPGSTIPVTLGTTERQVWAAFAVTNDGGIHATSAIDTGSTATARPPAITTTINDCLLIRIVGTDVSTGNTLPMGVPTGWTALGSGQYGLSAGAVQVFYKAMPTAGTEPIANVSLAVAEQWWTCTFAIAPSSGAATVSPTAIGTGEALGSPTVSPGAVTLAHTAITSAQALGSPAILPGTITLAPVGIASVETAGNGTVSPGAVTLALAGIQSSEVLGTLKVNQAIVASGVASGEALGNPGVASGVAIISPVGLGPINLYGNAIVSTGGITLAPAGLGTAEALGSPLVSVVVIILAPMAIAPDDGFGDPLVSPGAVLVMPVGYSNPDTFGLAIVYFTALRIAAIQFGFKKRATEYAFSKRSADLEFRKESTEFSIGD